MSALLSLVVGWTLAHAVSCRELLAAPIDLGAIRVDRARLAELTGERQIRNAELAAREAEFKRAEARTQKAREGLNRFERWLEKWPVSPRLHRYRRALENERHARIARSNVRDQLNLIDRERQNPFRALPIFRELAQALGKVQDAGVDAENLLADLDAIALRLERTRETEEWERNHAFDPRFFMRAEIELERAREAITDTNSLYVRLHDAARALGLMLPADTLPRPVLDDAQEPGVSLRQAMEEVDRMQRRVRQLDEQLRELGLSIARRLEEYMSAALG